MARFLKDPDATLDYVFDWTDWLAAAETISSHTVTVNDPNTDVGASLLTRVSSSAASGVVTVWLTGGEPSQTSIPVTCHITTSAGRTDDRTFHVRVLER